MAGGFGDLSTEELQAMRDQLAGRTAAGSYAFEAAPPPMTDADMRLALNTPGGGGMLNPDGSLREPGQAPTGAAPVSRADVEPDLRAAALDLGQRGVEAPRPAALPPTMAPATPMGFAPAAAPPLAPSAPGAGHGPTPARPPGYAPSATAAPGMAPPPDLASAIAAGAQPESVLEPTAAPVEGITQGTVPDESKIAEGSSAVTPGLLPSGETRQEAAVKLTPDEQSRLDQSFETQRTAEEKAIHAEADARAAERWAGKAGAARAADVQAADAAKQEMRATEFQKLIAQHNETAKRIADEGITKPSLWTGNAGDDITRGIGLFLMGLGGADVSKTVDGILDRDLNLQKDRLAKKRADWETQGLLLEQVGKQYDSEAARDAAAKDIALQGINQEVMRFASFSKDPAVQARAEAMLAENQQKQVVLKAQIEGSARDVVTRAYTPPKAMGGIGKTPLQQLKERNEYMRELGLDPEKYIPTLDAYATGPKADADALKESGALAHELSGTLMEMKRISQEKQSARIPGTEADRQMDALKLHAVTTYKNIAETKGMPPEEGSMISAGIASLGIGGLHNESATYDKLSQLVLSGFRRKAHELGTRPSDGVRPMGFTGAEKQSGFVPEASPKGEGH